MASGARKLHNEWLETFNGEMMVCTTLKVSLITLTNRAYSVNNML